MQPPEGFRAKSRSRTPPSNAALPALPVQGKVVPMSVARLRAQGRKWISPERQDAATSGSSAWAAVVAMMGRELGAVACEGGQLAAATKKGFSPLGSY
jgi:hypothetical protein